MVSEGPGARDQAKPGAAIRCRELVKIFQDDGVTVSALRSFDLEVAAGELVAVVGPAGSGKSTLMKILAGFDVPTAGHATVAGLDLLTLSAGDRVKYRRDVVGFVSQETARNLMPYLTATENVALPLSLRGVDRQIQAERADELLQRVGLAQQADLRPGRLSAGERQRLAIGVALANGPRVLLADEPTGELEPGAATDVIDVLRRATVDLGVTGLVATQNSGVSEQAGRMVAIGETPEVISTTPGHAPWTMPLSTRKPSQSDKR